MTPALELRGLSKRFGGLTATDDVSLSVPAGSLHALIGPNGAGKTTLINQVAGDLRHDAGAIMLGGIEIGALPAWAARALRAGAHLPDRAIAAALFGARQCRARDPGRSRDIAFAFLPTRGRTARRAIRRCRIWRR